jgi:hypothetical protein
MVCRSLHRKIQPLYLAAAALLVAENVYAASDCGPINPKTGKPCLTSGSITSTPNGPDDAIYAWHFDNSCDHGIDIILRGARPTIMPPGTDFKCSAKADTGCPWTHYECPSPIRGSSNDTPSMKKGGVPANDPGSTSTKASALEPR